MHIAITGNMVYLLFKYASISVAVFVGLYAGLLGLLTTSFFQAHVVYLHKIQMTWFKDLDVPENFGFLHGQITPFSIKRNAVRLAHSTHRIISSPSGFALDITPRFAFKLLRDDPDARLIIHMHGAGGTVGSGYRVPNYRALSAGQPKTIHVLTFDYRGFGRSLGTPSECGLCLDAIAVVDWATEVAGIPSSQILIFSQSVGTAVSLAVSEHFAL